MDLGDQGAARYIRAGRDYYTVSNTRGEQLTFLRELDTDTKQHSAHLYLCEQCASPVSATRTTRPATPRAIIQHANSHWMPEPQPETAKNGSQQATAPRGHTA